MTQITILVPPPLRRFVGGQDRVPAQASTVREAMLALTARSDALRDQLLTADGDPRRFIRVFLDSQPVVFRPGHDEPVRDGAELTILLALAGG